MTQFDQRYQQVETQYNAGGDINVYQPPLSLTEAQRKRNRSRMLERVQAIWIDGVLEPSLQGGAYIALELENKPSLVVTPLSVPHEFDKTGQLSSADASIVRVYDRANKELLILGEPGAGKTTLLLELTRALLERARQHEDQPIPVIFPLSSWATSRQPLTEWLIAGLHSRYQIPIPLATSWIMTDQVLPLLDGLDEVATPHRKACVEVINAYRQDHGLLPTVVCSRLTDYLALSTRLLLRTAVVVQPLTEEQIASYLASEGDRLEALRQALLKDADLRALSSSPLMLNVLSQVYQESTPQEFVTTGSLGSKRDQVFTSYVQRMLTHRNAKSRYTPQQTIHWLSSLAEHMKRQNHTIFYIEQMQPDWLSSNRMLRAFDWLGLRLPSMLIGALVGLAVTAFLSPINLSYSIISIVLGGFLGELWSGRYVAQRFVASEEKPMSVTWMRILQWLGTGVLIGLIVAFGFWLDLHIPLKSLPSPFLRLFWLSLVMSLALSFGIWNPLLQILFEKSNTAENSHLLPVTMFQRLERLIRNPGVGNGLLTGLLFALISGIVFALVNGLVFVLVYSLGFGLLFGLFLGLAVGFTLGLFLGLSSGFLSAQLIQKGAMVQPVDQLIWSWGSLGGNLFSKRHIRPSLVFGLVFGLVSVPIYLLIYVLATGLTFKLVYLYGGLITGLINGLIIGLGYWLLLGFWQGVSSATIEDQRRMAPNQGIHRSAFNSLALGLVSFMIVGLTASLSKWLTSKLTDSLGAGLFAGLLAGLFAGIVAGLLNGGLACLRHYLLRFLLWRAGSIPWNYIQFLDDAAASILLRKVGGGYIFLHRLLLDYFANLETDSGSLMSTKSRQEKLPPETMPP